MAVSFSEILILASSAIIFSLGLAHLVVTYRGPKLTPRNPDLIDMMKSTSPVISTQTTMWRAWVGFNASHSLGAMLFGSVYGFLAVSHSDLLFHSMFLSAVGILVLISYALMGWRYWFNVPFIGIILSLVLYVSGYVVAIAA